MIIKKHAIKRKLIQVAAFGFTNSRLGNFSKGTLYQGSWKQFCAPGLNCYSCPAATFACPIGAMQSVASGRHMSFSFYAVGIILALGVMLGRAICGFLCPFGLIQEIIYLIKAPKFKLPKPLRYLKYLVLLVFVVLLPALLVDMTKLGKPWFCQYICPAGTLEAGIPLVITDQVLRKGLGLLFFTKLSILIVVLILCIFVYRFFCKALCPLGALYGLLNKISLLHLECDKTKCNECGKCKSVCLMDVDPSKQSRSSECILCGRCTHECSQHALRIALRPELEKKEDVDNV